MRYRNLLRGVAIALLVSSSPVAPAASPPRCGPAQASIDALRERRDWYAALAEIERGLACSPSDPALLRQRVRTLGDIGSNDAAWRLAQGTPGLLDRGEMEVLASKRLARLIGWTEVGRDEAERLAAAQQALQASENELARVQGEDSAAVVRMRLDRMLLLNRLGRHHDVVSEYTALTRQGVAMPAYVAGPASDSLMALHRPEEAAALVAPLLGPTVAQAPYQVRHAFAELEMERGDTAIAELRAYAAEQPPQRWDRQHRARQRNWARYDADLARIQITGYAGEPAIAQEELEQMLRIAPGNGGLHSALGQAYLMQGWPRRALDRFRVAAMYDPQDQGAAIGQVEALMALSRDDEAAPLHARLVTAYPGSTRVAQLDRAWQRHRGWQWQATAAGGRSSGNTTDAPLGTRDTEYAFGLLTPLIAHHWRVRAGYLDRMADLRDEQVRRRDARAGLQFARGGFDASIDVRRAGAAAPRRSGLDLRLGWQMGDYWSLAAGYHRNASDASLQAQQAGIGADRYDAAVAYRADDRHDWQLAFGRLEYDDGNRRDSVLSRYEQRLAGGGRWSLEGSGSVYASHASLADAPYFNPRRDASLDVGLRVAQRAWRNYGRHFLQHLELGAGRYWQEDFGGSWIPSARYEHEWRLAPGRTLRYGVSWARPVYDGGRERRLALDAGFHWEE